MKTAKIILLSIGGLVVLAVGAAVAVWFNLEWIATEPRLKDALAQALTLTQPPEHVSLSIDNRGWRVKHIDLKISRFCTAVSDSSPLQGCFNDVEAAFSFKVTGIIHFELLDVGPLIVKSEDIKIIPPTKKPKPDKKPAEPFELGKYLSIAKNFKVSGVDVQLPKTTIENAGKISTASLTLTAPTSDLFKLVGTYSIPKGIQARVNIEGMSYESGATPLTLQFEVKDSWRATGVLKGQIAWAGPSLSLDGSLQGKHLVPWLETIEFGALSIHWDKTLTVNSKFGVNIVPQEIEPKGQIKSVLPPATLLAKFDGTVDIKEVPFQDKTKYLFHVILGPNQTRGIILHADVEGELPLALKRADIEARVPDFQKVVKSLKGTSAAIPAPFNVMTGQIDLRIGSSAGAVAADRINFKIPVAFNTDLRSTEQTLILTSSGTVESLQQGKEFKIDGGTEIKSFKFTLPNFDPLQSNVSLKRDSRIQSEVAIAKAQIKKEVKANPPPSKTKVSYRWKISTIPSGIRIFHPFFDPYAPMTFNWMLASDGNEGKLTIEPFDIQYLNRTAKVHNFFYQLTPGEKNAHFEGRLVIPKTEYTIFLDVVELGGKAKLTLESSPPLSEDDIVSVLLFNQTTAELTPDESSSVANTQSAITNRALGLFSIWALSSTPIEAVNYNPASRVYSARVKLANGLTATFGTDWETSQEVALRKRLGSNFVLSTIFETDKNNTESKKALIEWFKRF
ncbi:MAG: hypothetical protein JST80_02265 [Bdellovibrionales bacterium]|nr:hypothetical protein [Bdellovibrionales bacterium]